MAAGNPWSSGWDLGRLEDRWRWVRADGAWIELHEAEDGTVRVADSRGKTTAFARFALAHAHAWRLREEL
jgi:hypothetical protein